MFKSVERVLGELKRFMQGIKVSMVENATGALELEYVELESAFLLMVIGSLAGLVPMPPVIAVEILPSLRDEIALLEDRAYRGSDVIGDLFSGMGGEW